MARFCVDCHVNKVVHEPPPRRAYQLKARVMVGICASGDDDLAGCVGSVLKSRTENVAIERIVVVASSCRGEAVRQLNITAKSDYRIKIIVEEKRRGKALAINTLLSEFYSTSSDFLVFVNGDSLVAGNSIEELVSTALNQKADLVGGLPIPRDYYEAKFGAHIASIYWKIHNTFLSTCSVLGVDGHATDELMCLSRRMLTRIPNYTINDGAYLATIAHNKGLRVGFSQHARVYVDTPSSLKGLLVQRARILRGHLQITRTTGTPPVTLESSLLLSPAIAFETITALLRENGLVLLLEASLVEAAAWLLMLSMIPFDRRPWIWRRVSTT